MNKDVETIVHHVRELAERERLLGRTGRAYDQLASLVEAAGDLERELAAHRSLLRLSVIERDEARAERDKARAGLTVAEHLLKKIETHLRDELDRGYVLSYEPLAGQTWRHRTNEALGWAESARAATQVAIEKNEEGA